MMKGINTSPEIDYHVDQNWFGIIWTKGNVILKGSQVDPGCKDVFDVYGVAWAINVVENALQ